MTFLSPSRRLFPTIFTRLLSSNPKPINNIYLPPLIPTKTDSLKDFSIEVVDTDLWSLSYGLSQSHTEPTRPFQEPFDEDGCDHVGDLHDFDEIESLRLQKKLVYKVDKNSIEYDECNVDFHKTKSSKRARERKGCKKVERVQNKGKDTRNAKMVMEKLKPMKVERQWRDDLALTGEWDLIDELKHKDNGKAVCEKFKPEKLEKLRREDWGLTRERGFNSARDVMVMEGKRERVPTFNQVTDPYHLPFCLDIFISKGSVSASVVHRVTSKVVAVAHSISKDMKIDLKSRKDSVTSGAIGKILAQRALEDDIHNVVYTPRKGDRIEGKLQIVLQSIIDNGIDVKVKLKQKKHIKRTYTDTS